jgi:hypothetical protein
MTGCLVIFIFAHDVSFTIWSGLAVVNHPILLVHARFMPVSCRFHVPYNGLVSFKVCSFVSMERQLVILRLVRIIRRQPNRLRDSRRRPHTTSSLPFMPVSLSAPFHPSNVLVSCKVSLSGDGGGVWLLVTHDVSSPSGSDQLLSAPYY